MAPAPVGKGSTVPDRTIRGYRPWLDGVRAVAVVLVVARHAGAGWASHAGGPAVALFFALSGYLITGLLLDERDRHGRVDLAGFYLRRAARLLPGLVVMLAVCDALFVLVGERAAVRDSLFALAYAKNYHDAAVGSHGYFGQTWSLSVEEHFYLLWPVALLAVLAVSRRGQLAAALRLALGLSAGALALRCALLAWHGPSLLLYMGSLSRADGLLVGCAVAIAVRRGLRVPPLVTALCAGVFTLTVWPGAHPQVWEQSIGYTVQGLAGAGLVAGLDAAPSPARWLLSRRPVVMLGRLSYGLYLWHITALGLLVPRLPAPWGAYVVAPAVAVAAAALSYRYVETPARRWIGARRTRSRQVASGRQPWPSRTAAPAVGPATRQPAAANAPVR